MLSSMLIPLDELVERHGVRPTGIVHIGAHEGQELDSYLRHRVPRVVWIEANPAIFRVLQDRLAPHPHHRAFQFAAHERDGLEVALHVMVNTMSSSILEPKRHLELYPHITVTERIAVRTRTLDAFFADEGLSPAEFNFLNMDIQGAELMALRGAQQSLAHFDYVYTEVNDDVMFDGCCLTPELDAFLGARGFARVATRMTPDGWGDALYVRQHRPARP